MNVHYGKTGMADDTAYNMLSIAIINQAVIDYEVIYSHIILGDFSSRVRYAKKYLEEFFKGDAYSLYSHDVPSDKLIRRAKLRGVQRAYQYYIKDLAYDEKTERMKMFEHFLNSKEFAEISTGTKLNPCKILADADKYAEIEKMRKKPKKDRGCKIKYKLEVNIY